MQSGGTSVSRACPERSRRVQPGGDARRSTGKLGSAAKARCANSSQRHFDAIVRKQVYFTDLLHYVFGFLASLLHAFAGCLGAFFHAFSGILGSGLSGIAGFVGSLFSGFARSEERRGGK